MLNRSILQNHSNKKSPRLNINTLKLLNSYKEREVKDLRENIWEKYFLEENDAQTWVMSGKCCAQYAVWFMYDLQIPKDKKERTDK